MQFEFREVIDASPERVFETLGNGFGDVSTWAGGVEGGGQASAHPTAPHMGTGE